MRKVSKEEVSKLQDGYNEVITRKCTKCGRLVKIHTTRGGENTPMTLEKRASYICIICRPLKKPNKDRDI